MLEDLVFLVLYFQLVEFYIDDRLLLHNNYHQDLSFKYLQIEPIES